MTDEMSSGWAYKEWASVCAALMAGTQQILVRKGGIHEAGDEFQPEHAAFWLMPTHFHQQPDELTAAGQAFLPAAQLPAAQLPLAQLPAAQLLAADSVYPGSSPRLALSVHVSLTAWWRVEQAEKLASLSAYHILSPQTLRKRFDYRQPGLYVLLPEVRVEAQPHVIEDRPHYAGCKTWVELDRELTVSSDAQLVTAPRQLAETRAALSALLTPGD